MANPIPILSKDRIDRAIDAVEIETLIKVTAPLNSADFMVHIENASPSQLWAAGHMLIVMGNSEFARTATQVRSNQDGPVS